MTNLKFKISRFHRGFSTKSEQNLKFRKGFTMVELMVALSVFLVLTTMSSGVFIRSLRTQRQVAALIAANSNAQLTLEQMMREMRTGEKFSVPAEGEIGFTNAKNESVTYRLNNGALEKGISGDFQKLTANNVEVKKLNFLLFEGSGAEKYSPRITIIIQISPYGFSSGENTVINLQTTVSSRVLSS